MSGLATSTGPHGRRRTERGARWRLPAWSPARSSGRSSGPAGGRFRTGHRFPL